MNKPKLIAKHVKDTVNILNLKLENTVVLTEATNGYWAATACVPAYAGAKVYAYAEDNKFSTKEEKIKDVKELAEELGVTRKISFIKNLSEYLTKVDIVTNSYSLRPLNKEKLSKLKPGAKVLLMYEEWEKREKDVDYKYCKKNNISVIPTNESRDDFNIFQYVGWIAIKTLLENNINVVRNRIAVIGEDKFAEETVKILKRNNAEVLQIKNKINYENLSGVDTIIFCDYENNININWKKLNSISENYINLIQLVGVKKPPLDFKNIKLIPDKKIPLKNMPYTFEYLGPQPVIEIITASYKNREKK